MKKIILVDGNNLLFRSYYATVYSGNIMKNSKNFPTNALFGFVNMINKIITEENPEYMLVAFDIGKTFRHEKYDNYKDGRSETPEELKMQFPKAKEILTIMGIKYLETPGYEADDIIGTYAKLIDENPSYQGLIVSSDKDLLQLITKNVVVKLLKSKDYIMMTEEKFKETYGVIPPRMTDLKGLMGDASDNIPGVKGIGEKTAIKLLSEYQTLENLYENLDNIKGATHAKLKEGRESAFLSREIATIYKEVPVPFQLDDIKIISPNTKELINIYNELEFYSLIKKLENPKPTKNKELKIDIITDLSNLKIEEDTAIYLEVDEFNYHKANIKGLAIYNKKISAYIKMEDLKTLDFIKGNIYTYDHKKNFVSLNRKNITIKDPIMDIMIACYLLNYNVKDDIAYIASSLDYNLPFYDKKEQLTEEEFIKRAVQKAKFIYEITPTLTSELEKENLTNLYQQIELPLSTVLGKMESEGIKCDKNFLDKMGKDMEAKIEDVKQIIYNLSGEEFNINSPKQLGEILFEKLNLPSAKKKKTGSYSTDEQTLKKLIGYPIIEYILEYRMLTKLYNTYIEGLKNSIMPDGKIHTIYTQTLTRTGRLSSVEPNLQNIPIKNEYGRLIRKSFIAEKDSLLLSSDYSQIELRIFASLAKEPALTDAFKHNLDIHKKTASDIYNIPLDKVTKEQRRSAKAVNFGIIYGISSYGLSEDLNITPKEAKSFIDKYLETYKGIKEYMDQTKEQAKMNGYVKTIMNRKRIIDEINNKNYYIRSMGERMALNTPIQGSSADILKKAMVEINKQLEEKQLQSKMLLQIHDELVFNVVNKEQEIIEKIVKTTMENVVNLEVPLIAELSYGKNLYDAK